MTDTAALIRANSARWQNAKLTRSFDAVARRLVAGKPRYVEVAQATNVPWFVIAVIHEREASGNWNAQLGQGDPLSEVSRHVPAGRGPFSTWKAGAIDELTNCAPYASRWTDWSAGGALTLLEKYNGLGYANKGLPSPYVWSGTDQYTRGKYVADGVFDANAVDQQLGCAGLLLAMSAIDPSVKLGSAALPAPQIPPVEAPPPTVKHKVGTAIVVGTSAAASHAIGLPWWGILAIVAGVIAVPLILSKLKG